MAKYRKKPVVIEAEQFLMPSVHPLPFADRNAVTVSAHGYYVVTAHGQKVWLEDGDWIIPEPDGRGFYPCKPYIFAATYELVDERPPTKKGGENPRPIGQRPPPPPAPPRPPAARPAA
jgi:hypothetical protein